MLVVNQLLLTFLISAFHKRKGRTAFDGRGTAHEYPAFPMGLRHHVQRSRMLHRVNHLVEKEHPRR